MTRVDNTLKPNRPRFLAAPVRREPDVRAMLREIAYVLHVTRRVKAEILAEREERDARRLPSAANAV